MSTLATPIQAPEYYSVAKAAELLGCSRQLIAEHIEHGELTAVDISPKLGGPRRALRISRASIDDFVARRRINPQEAVA